MAVHLREDTEAERIESNQGSAEKVATVADLEACQCLLLTSIAVPYLPCLGHCTNRQPPSAKPQDTCTIVLQLP